MKTNMFLIFLIELEEKGKNSKMSFPDPYPNIYNIDLSYYVPRLGSIHFKTVILSTWYRWYIIVAVLSSHTQ